ILVRGKTWAPANTHRRNQTSIAALGRIKGGFMKTRRTLYLGFVASVLAALLTACLSTQGTGSAGDIGGVVNGPNGPEAGVWVIAETNDLPTKFAKLVVTDDRGRFLIPDLPKANYR